MSDKKSNVSTRISILLLVVLGLLLLLDVFTEYLLKNITNLEKILIYVVIFIIPIIVYLRLNKYKASRALGLRHFKLRYLPFVLLAGVSISIICSFINVLNNVLLSRFGLNTAVTSTVSFSSDSPIVIAMSLVLLPALCEELLIRGVALYEYGKYGVAVSVLMTSVIFALFHGSPATMLSLFAAGVIYAVMTHLFRSVWPAFICHAINNALAVYISYHSDFIKYLASDVLFIIIIIAVICLVFYFTLRLGENIADELGGKNRLKTNVRKLAYGDPLKSVYIWIFLAVSIYISIRRFI